MLDGARHLTSRPPAAYALAAITAARFLFGVMTVLTLLVYRNHFTDSGLLRAGLPGLTQVVVASGVGTVTAAVVTPVAARRVGKPAWLAGSLLLGGVAVVTLGLPYTLSSFLGAGLVLGFVMQASKISVDTVVQEQVDDEFRGRVFSVYDTLFNVSFVAAAALAAGILPDDGVSGPVVAALGIGYGLTAVGYGAATFRQRPPSHAVNSRA
jgi:MFS family permease